jgi:hypothetical protein
MSEQLTVPYRETQPPPHIPVTRMNREETLNYIADRYRQRCRTEAELIQGLAHFATLTPPKRPGIDLGDGAAEELALELNLSPNTTAKHLTEAQEMTTRLPATVDALEAGEIDIMRAKAIHDYTADLDSDQATMVGKQENLTRFKHAIRREVIRIDPHTAEDKRHHAQTKRGVSRWHKPDGTSSLTIQLQPHETELAYTQIDMLAKHARTNRADVFMDLVCGKKHNRPPATINVLVPMTTLMGLNQEPGEITGVGPITAQYARELADNATWRRILTDPTGHILEVSNRRYASPALKRHIQLRDRTCRQPGCTVPAHRSELDHTKPHAHGGTTSPDNLAALCKRHNLMRQRTTWKMQQPTPGALTFTTPTGRTITTKPDPYDIPPF